MPELTSTQKAFADRIIHDVLELFRDDQAVLDIIRGRVRMCELVDRFRLDLYNGVANYDLVRSGQIEILTEQVRRFVNVMPPVIVRPGNYDTSIGHGCDECGNTHGDAHSSTCTRGSGQG